METEQHGHHPHEKHLYRLMMDEHGWHLDIHTKTKAEMLLAVEATMRFLLAEGECGNLDFRVT